MALEDEVTLTLGDLSLIFWFWSACVWFTINYFVNHTDLSWFWNINVVKGKKKP